MLVRWERHGPGEHQTHAARVIEILTEPCRGGMIVQRKIRVEYERQGMRPLWHTPSDLTPLAEGAVLATSGDEEVDSDEEMDVFTQTILRHPPVSKVHLLL